ncbi:hypothetical protein BLOT_015338 [Blomia tropicalis]|nr:hypothetical protein BLOT_015338 [Blomia tropicalis]
MKRKWNGLKWNGIEWNESFSVLIWKLFQFLCSLLSTCSSIIDYCISENQDSVYREGQRLENEKEKE